VVELSRGAASGSGRIMYGYAHRLYRPAAARCQTIGHTPTIVRYSPRQPIDASRGVNCPLEGRRSSVTAKVLDKSLLRVDPVVVHAKLIRDDSSHLQGTFAINSR